MAELKIKKVPNAFLRKKPNVVIAVSPEEIRDLSNMADTMYLNQGVGLAATQVGINKQLAVVDVGMGLIKLINPAIIKKEGTETQEEGCLSVPEACVKVKRAKRVLVSYIDENGRKAQMCAEGLLARAIQHEVDHLTGVLIVDYLNPIQRIFLKKRGRRQKDIN